MAWPGGKDGSGVCQRLINEIPPHEVFISAFLGDCAILRRKKPAALSIGIDVDRRNIQRWSTAPTVPNLKLLCCDAIEWLRCMFDFYAVTDLSKGAQTIHDSIQTGDGHLVPTRQTAAGSADAQSGDCGRTRSMVAPFGGARAFVYADPPYLLSSRRSPKRLYASELSDEAHGELLATLVALPCLVMVSHYPHPLYAAALQDWRTFTFRAQTRGGKMATEQVWCNYAPPVELHDARYLGRNKRERERVRRRVRRWTAGLARMAPLERQAVLDSLQGR